MNIHTRFKKLRGDQGLTQQKFADKIKSARGTISAIESGSSSPGNRLLADVCETFNVNKDWLEYGEGEMYIKNYQDDELAFLLGRFAADNDGFKKRFITSMLKLDDEGWKVIENLIDDMAKKKTE